MMIYIVLKIKTIEWLNVWKNATENHTCEHVEFWYVNLLNKSVKF
jgi:predicted nucleotidyltransferase